MLLGTGCFFILLVTLVQPFYNINLWFEDQFIATEAPSPNIVIAGIDDDTLESFGRWAEWPRSLHVQAIANLNEAGVTVIGFDVLFTDVSPDDEILAATIEDAQNVVLASAGTEPILIAEHGYTFQEILLPVTRLKQASSNTGHASVFPDPDGKVRYLALIVEDAAGQTYPAFTLAVLHTLFHMQLPSEYTMKNDSLHLLARDIPVDDSYSLRINYTSASENYAYVSYGNIIQGDFDPAAIKNKIVLIGMTATGELDRWAVPTSASKVPGVFIHAAAMDTILRERFLSEASIATTALTMLLLSCIVAFVLPLCGTWYWTDIVKGTGLIVGLFVIYLFASSFIFDRGYILNILYPLLILPILYISNILYIIVVEQADKRFVKELFGRYVSPEVARKIVSLANAGELDLGGEEKDVTVLFADIRNFTPLSEQMTPDAVVSMLNSYLSIVVDTIAQNGGIINKFGGDNVMAVWNAPQSQADHALLAVRAAWGVQQNLVKLQQDNPLLPVVKFGIGINTGMALAGNIGSTGRAEYTVIGDTVNLASRICNSAPGDEVWIGPETYQQTANHIAVEELEQQTFKGKSGAVAVYRVISVVGSNSSV